MVVTLPQKILGSIDGDSTGIGLLATGKSSQKRLGSSFGNRHNTL